VIELAEAFLARIGQKRPADRSPVRQLAVNPTHARGVVAWLIRSLRIATRPDLVRTVTAGIAC
jgi:hypothetical protein